MTMANMAKTASLNDICGSLILKALQIFCFVCNWFLIMNNNRYLVNIFFKTNIVKHVFCLQIYKFVQFIPPFLNVQAIFTFNHQNHLNQHLVDVFFDLLSQLLYNDISFWYCITIVWTLFCVSFIFMSPFPLFYVQLNFYFVKHNFVATRLHR